MKLSISILISLIIAFCLFSLLGQYKVNPEVTFVDIQMKIKKDDVIHVFYKKNQKDKYRKNRSVSQDIIGNENSQLVTLTLPVDKEIERIRIDLGQNRKQQPIEIETIHLRVNNKEIILDETRFRTNIFLESTGKIYTPKVVGKKYNPYILSDVIAEEIKLIREEVPGISLLLRVILSLLISIPIFISIYISDLKFQVNQFPEIAFSTLFLVLILTPTLVSIFQDDQVISNKEKRKLAKKPEVSFTREYTSGYEDYYNDNFGLRNEMINASASIKANLVKVSPKVDDVVIGKDGYLFYNKKRDNIYKSYSNRNLLSSPELEAKYAQVLKRKKLLNDKGIKFVFGFWPNKHSIHVDEMTFAMKLQKVKKESLADQMIKYFSEQGLHIVDVRETLIRKKDQRQVYRKLDTHWNSYGAFLAYQEMFNSSYKELGIKPLSEADYNISYQESKKGDLVKMMGLDSLNSVVESLPSFSLILPKPRIKYKSVEGYPARTLIIRNESVKNDQKMLMFRDSYTTAMVQFLSMHYREIVFIWKTYDQKIVDKVNPDVVLSFKVERYLKSI